MRHWPTLPVCFQTLQIKNIKNNFVFDVSVTFHRKNLSATPGALYTRRLHVGAPCSIGAKLQTGENQIQPVLLLYEEAIPHLCLPLSLL